MTKLCNDPAEPTRGPCVLFSGHPEHWHQDDDGTEWHKRHPAAATTDSDKSGNCPVCLGSGWVRQANGRPYLSWAYREWDERCSWCEAPDQHIVPPGENGHHRGWDCYCVPEWVDAAGVRTYHHRDASYWTGRSSIDPATVA